jgi:hypothetical protein
MSLDSQTETPPLETMNRLRAVECAECGAIFAVPSNLFLDRMHEHGALFCPSGHTINLLADPENPNELRLIEVQLLIGRDYPNPEITEDEFERRVRLLSSCANINSMTRKTVCGLCGSSHRSDADFRRHLRRYHTDRIRSLSEDSKYFKPQK